MLDHSRTKVQQKRSAQARHLQIIDCLCLVDSGKSHRGFDLDDHRVKTDHVRPIVNRQRPALVLDSISHFCFARHLSRLQFLEQRYSVYLLEKSTPENAMDLDRRADDCVGLWVPDRCRHTRDASTIGAGLIPAQSVQLTRYTWQ